MNEDSPVTASQTENQAEKLERGGAPRLKSLRTYQGDVQEAMAKNHTSIVHVAAAEQQRKEREVKPVIVRKNDEKNKVFILLGLLLFILGLVTLGSIYYIRSHTKPLEVTEKNSILTYSKAVQISTTSTRNGFIENFLREKQSTQLPINELVLVEALGSDKKPLSVQNFLSLAAPSMPSPLARSFGQTYMVGIYSYDTNAPFIILTTDDFGISYSGMLRWEEKMVDDLGPLFSITPVSSTTTYTFKDGATHSKDLRIAVNQNGKTVLLYSFINKNTLIITSDENIFNALLGKYQTTKMVR